ncbi:MAG: hypothetical protein AAB834_01215 [Patescibacteria group bacterium]
MMRRLTVPSFLAVCAASLCMLFSSATPLLAASVENPQEGAIGIEGKIPSNPPTAGATITTPTNGQSFGRIPITVSGLCPTGLLVKIFANNVFVGSVLCEKGSYSIQIDLFSGRNDLIARVFDSLDQAGPDSNVVSVTFNDEQFNPFGTALLNLTSNYAKRGANPGERLTWPVILSGGTGPYAISVDWGDNKAPDLISREFTGTIDLSHVYDNAGIYKVTIKATDKNGLSAFLQVVAVANGAVTSDAAGEEKDNVCEVIVRVLWQPALACLLLIFISFWLGRKYELATLRKHLEQREK